MSGAQTSTFADPNILYKTLSGAGYQEVEQNRLMNQERQQGIAANNTEVVARAASTLIDPSLYPTEEARAAAYPGIIKQLKDNGYAPNAPAEYPGLAHLQAAARMGTPSADLFKLQQNQAGWGQITGDGGGSTATGGTGGGAPASSAPATTVTPSGGATIGQRQNNPGNLTFAGQPGASPGQGNRFASFPDMPTGVAANADQLALYQTQHGINTVRGAVTRWVGDPKADLTSYIGDVAKAIGVGPDDKIDLTNPDVQAKFIQAQFPHESAGGGFVLNPADVQKGVQMAAANRGRSVQATGTAIATPAVAPGGVAARVGGTDVAGPGAGPGGAPGGDLVGPRVLPPIGPGSPVVTPQSLANTPTPQPQAQVPQPPPNRVMPGGPDGPPVQQPPAPVVAQQQPPAPVQPAARPAAPAAGGLLAGLSPDQVQAVLALRRSNGTPAQGLAMIEHFKEVNASAAHQTLEEQRQQEQLRLSQVTSQREQEAAAALAEQRRIENQRQQESAARDAQRLAIEQKKAEQGTTQDDRDFYNLRTEDPSSQKYADSYVNQKWKIAPNGNVIEQDMSRYPAPNRNIQRPTFLPAPTPQGLDEVRKADTDAKVITSGIDHYVDVFKAVGGGSWDTFFDDPTSVKSQQLLGAFSRLRTVLRSPAYYNTGVLQPAEIALMGQDLVSPQSLRGVYATPEALATRMGEIKLAVLTRQDAELRSIGKDGVIVRDKADYNKVPAGGRYYDENGNLKVKPGKE